MKIDVAAKPLKNESARERDFWPSSGVFEMIGILVLALLTAYFLGQSWRKWADPMVDSGPQWYAIWRVSLGAVPYHDFGWNYGPLSLLFNGLLFKCFGPGMMVLVTANLLIYLGTATLAYLAFRKAWGKLAAFTALAVFISVFSFSMLNTVGNYNYVLPYTHEVTHGMLLMLATVFVMVRWCRQSSATWAFLLGLCGGLAAVLKPEFMLAAGVLGITALIIRLRQGQPPRFAECGMILTGVALPTLAFAAWFARIESWKAALLDSCHAWGTVFVHRIGPAAIDQSSYMGFNHGWRNVGWELEATAWVVIIVGALWAAGWFFNRPWLNLIRLVTVLGAIALAYSVDMGGFEIGPSFPGLMIIILVVIVARVVRDLRQTGRIEEHHLMALTLVLLAGAMLARMALRARINHFGFIQAAFAGMVAAAFVVSEIPPWTGPSPWGRRITLAGIMAMLIFGCSAVVIESAHNHASQTQSVGEGLDRFYAFDSKIDETGAMVNWCAQHLRVIPPNATLLVLPDGTMLNYLTRHARPIPDFLSDEDNYIQQLAQTPPDYVVLIWGDHREGAVRYFGDPGKPGEKIVDWLHAKYTIENTHFETTPQGGKQWAFIMRRKTDGHEEKKSQ
jgi:hypothetical protein